MPSAARRSPGRPTLNQQLSFVLTCIGGLALVLVGLGVIIIYRSIARPLSQITATIKQVAEGAENVEVPHTDRADEIGALARAIQIFKEAMGHNRNLNSQVSSEFQGPRSAHPADRNLGRRVPRRDRRRAARGDRQRVEHAQDRAVDHPA